MKTCRQQGCVRKGKTAWECPREAPRVPATISRSRRSVGDNFRPGRRHGHSAFRVGQVCCMIHCGSRGLGHQVCTDHLKIARERDKKIPHHDSHSPTGLCADDLPGKRGENISGRWLHQPIMHGQPPDNKAYRAKGSSQKHSPSTMGICRSCTRSRTMWRRSRSTPLDGHGVEGLCPPERATRAFGPGSRRSPAVLMSIGQPVIIPGSMGRILCPASEAGDGHGQDLRQAPAMVPGGS